MSKRPPQRFELTEEHVALLRAANVTWEGDDWGVPTIDPKRPWGSSGAVGEDMDAVLGGHRLGQESIPASRLRRYRLLNRELETALQIVLRTGSFEPGVYETTKDYGRDWRRVEG